MSVNTRSADLGERRSPRSRPLPHTFWTVEHRGPAEQAQAFANDLVVFMTERRSALEALSADGEITFWVGVHAEDDGDGIILPAAIWRALATLPVDFWLDPYGPDVDEDEDEDSWCSVALTITSRALSATAISAILQRTPSAAADATDEAIWRLDLGLPSTAHLREHLPFVAPFIARHRDRLQRLGESCQLTLTCQATSQGINGHVGLPPGWVRQFGSVPIDFVFEARTHPAWAH